MAETPEQIARRIAAEEKAAERADFLEDAASVFRETLKTMFPGAENDTWINQLFEAAKPRLTVGFDTTDILDLMIQNGETPDAFNNRFKGIFELDKDAMLVKKYTFLELQSMLLVKKRIR